MSEQVKISELQPAVTPLNPAGLFEFALGGQSFQASLQNIIDKGGTLSALTIDTTKDWQGFSISNMGGLDVGGIIAEGLEIEPTIDNIPRIISVFTSTVINAREIHSFDFIGQNTDTTGIDYAQIIVNQDNVTPGNEAGSIELKVTIDGLTVPSTMLKIDGLNNQIVASANLDMGGNDIINLGGVSIPFIIIDPPIDVVPEIDTKFSQASPSAGATIFDMTFIGTNSASETDTTYGQIIVSQETITDGAEDGSIDFRVTIDGATPASMLKLDGNLKEIIASNTIVLGANQIIFNDNDTRIQQGTGENLNLHVTDTSATAKIQLFHSATVVSYQFLEAGSNWLGRNMTAMGNLAFKNEGSGSSPAFSSDSASQTLKLVGNLDLLTNQLENAVMTLTVTGVSGITGLGTQTKDLDMDTFDIKMDTWSFEVDGANLSVISPDNADHDFRIGTGVGNFVTIGGLETTTPTYSPHILADIVGNDQFFLIQGFGTGSTDVASTEGVLQIQLGTSNGLYATRDPLFQIINADFVTPANNVILFEVGLSAIDFKTLNLNNAVMTSTVTGVSGITGLGTQSQPLNMGSQDIFDVKEIAFLGSNNDIISITEITTNDTLRVRGDLNVELFANATAGAVILNIDDIATYNFKNGLADWKGNNLVDMGLFAYKPVTSTLATNAFTPTSTFTRVKAETGVNDTLSTISTAPPVGSIILITPSVNDTITVNDTGNIDLINDRDYVMVESTKEHYMALIHDSDNSWHELYRTEDHINEIIGTSATGMQAVTVDGVTTLTITENLIDGQTPLVALAPDEILFRKDSGGTLHKTTLTNLKFSMISGTGEGHTIGADRYLSFFDHDDPDVDNFPREIAMPADVRISDLVILVGTNGKSEAMDVGVAVNGVLQTPLTITIQTNEEDQVIPSTGFVDVGKGERVSFFVESSTGTGNIEIISYTCLITQSG